MATNSKNKQSLFPIIGIGGSAGSYHALERFFTHMPVKSGIAFVVVMHLYPLHNMDVAGLLQKSSTMPVKEAEDGMLVKPNHVYIIPPGKDMGIHNGQLLLMGASRKNGVHMSIDYFLQSLSEDQWNKAVAIILSGMGSDGATGVRMIKEKLGMAMAQAPEDAEFDSMPLAAIKTSMVDYVLEPEQMPKMLMQYLSHPAISEPIDPEVSHDLNNQNQFQKVLMLLRAHTGHDFTLYKRNTIVRRMERRIAFHQLKDYAQYVNYLRENPSEIDLLFNELLIGVTKFFRDRPAFDSMRTQLYANLKEKKPGDAIRIWIAGCSTGEEAYAVAIIALEYIDSLTIKIKPKLQIFATDLDANAIEHARTGFYFNNIASEVSPERLQRFFIEKGEGYVVKKEVREVVIFAQHNLAKDAPFTRLDLICCRNVMIYLTTELQKKIIPVFHYSLLKNGLLFLGPAESLGMFSDAFQTHDVKWKIFEKKEGSASVGKMIDFPFDVTNQPKIKNHGVLRSLKDPVAESFNTLILEKYTPPSLLVTDKGEILYISGQVGTFLQIIAGEAVMNIHRMIKEELKYVLGNAIYQAFDQKDRVEVNRVKHKCAGKQCTATIVVEYLSDPPLQGLLLITFIDHGPVKKPKAVRSIDFKDTAVEELEKELIYTKQQLHTTIEQMETSLEELKSTNEELQSTNEELQSTNEEALTTKEEMQSLNEELMTINLQYQNKAEESTQLNNDMKNLLDSTETGTIFLDHQLNILRFTPQVNKLFNVIPTDVGRSITHIVTNFDYPEMENTILEVTERLSGRELEVKTKKGEWYNLRIMPYRTIDNFISGAVLTFTKITNLKMLEFKFNSLSSAMCGLLEQKSDATIIIDTDTRILAFNQSFLGLAQLQSLQAQNELFIDLCHEKWKTNNFDQLLLNYKGEEINTTIRHDMPGQVVQLFSVNLKPLPGNNGSTGMIVKFTKQS